MDGELKFVGWKLGNTLSGEKGRGKITSVIYCAAHVEELQEDGWVMVD